MARTALWWSAIIGSGAVALGLVTGCSGQMSAQVSDQPTSSAANQPTATTTTTGNGGGTTGSGTAGSAGVASAAVSRCHTADLSARLGTPTRHDDGGTVPLVYTNISQRVCTMDGFGGVDLHGPSDPNGAVDSLRRDPDVQGRDAASLPKPTLVRLAPGATAHTLITFHSPGDGDIGSLGSTSWTPTEVVCTPPNETTQLSTPWLPGVGVLRQDGATVSDTYIGPVQPGSA
jgi:hypothetical protein